MTSLEWFGFLIGIVFLACLGGYIVWRRLPKAEKEDYVEEEPTQLALGFPEGPSLREQIARLLSRVPPVWWDYLLVIVGIIVVAFIALIFFHDQIDSALDWWRRQNQ